MNRTLALRLFWVVSLVALIVFGSVNPTETTLAMPNSSRLQIELANTPTTRQQGLSGRTDLPINTGMLFVFDQPLIPAFWMKDMQFDLDIVWIDEEGLIVGVVERLQPDSYPSTVSPDVEVVYVLEVNGGQADRLGLQPGTQLELDDFAFE